MKHDANVLDFSRKMGFFMLLAESELSLTVFVCWPVNSAKSWNRCLGSECICRELFTCCLQIVHAGFSVLLSRLKCGTK